MSDLRLLKVLELNQALSIWLGIQFTKHQAAKQQDLGIQGDKCVLCNACSVYCTSCCVYCSRCGVCIFYSVCNVYYSGCDL